MLRTSPLYRLAILATEVNMSKHVAKHMPLVGLTPISMYRVLKGGIRLVD